MIIALIDILLIIGIVCLYLKRKKIRAEKVLLAKDFSTVSDEFQTLNSSLPVAFFYMTDGGEIEDVNSEFESMKSALLLIQSSDLQTYMSTMKIKCKEKNSCP